MNGQSEQRIGLIPSGNCVPTPSETGSDTPELFALIDAGAGDKDHLRLAQAACQTCVQFKKPGGEPGFCVEQRLEIATELWNRGVGVAVVGGENVVVASAERTLTEDPPAFKFDLSTIPGRADAALAALRQGLRAGQLSIAGMMDAAVSVGSSYLERLKDQQPDRYQKLCEKLGENDLNRGLRYVATTILQQKALTDPTSTKSLPYNVGMYKPETDDAIVDHFLEEAVHIHELGFTDPTRKAILFDAAFYEQLVRTYKNEAMSRGDFNDIVTSNPRNPIAALQRARAEHQAAYQTRADVSGQYVRPARRSRPDATQEVATADDEVAHRIAQAEQTYGPQHEHVRPADIRRFATRYSTMAGFEEALARYAKNVKLLSTRYPKDPEMRIGLIRKLSADHINNADKVAEDYRERLDTVLATSDGTVPRDALRRHVYEGAVSFADVRIAHTRDRLHERYKNRAMNRGDESWITMAHTERIAALYPEVEAEVAAENVYKLFNTGVLVSARAEMREMRQTSLADLEKVFSPRTHEYLTFSTALRALSPVQRLALSHQYGLVPLLYGREANITQFRFAALGGTSLEEYCETHVLPQCKELLETSKNPQQAMSASELGVDLATFDELLAHGTQTELVRGDNRLSMRGLRDATLVVGGTALYLHDKGFNWNWTEEHADAEAWVLQKVAAAYPPHLQELGTQYVYEALSAGVIELRGNSAGEYRIVFGNALYNVDLDDAERCVLANRMGIDRLLYGSDLTRILGHRLGDKQIEVTFTRQNQPTIVEFSQDDLAEELDIESQDPLAQFVLTLFGDKYDLDKLTAAQWDKLGDALLEAYCKRIEHANHRHEIQDREIQAQVAIAWTEAHGGNVTDVARQFSVAGNNVDEYIAAGLRFIREQLLYIPDAHLKQVTALLAKVERNQMPEIEAPAQNTAIPVVASTATARAKAAVRAHVEITSMEESDATSKSKSAKTTTSRHVKPDMDRPVEETPRATSKAASVKQEDLPVDFDPAYDPEENVDLSDKDFERHSTDAVRSYYNAIGKYKLLNAAQEVELSKAIEAGLFAQERLDSGLFSDKDEADLKRLVQIGQAAKQRMINSNLRWVVKIASRYFSVSSMGQLDLIQEGNLGLIRAVEKFDHTKGFKFSTYATWWIRQAITRARADKEREIRIPAHVYADLSRVTAFRRSFITKYGREPSDEEVAVGAKIEPKKLENLDELPSQYAMSLAYQLSDEAGATEFGDLLYDVNQPEVDHSTLRADRQDIISRTLGYLADFDLPQNDHLRRSRGRQKRGEHKKMAQIITLYYGLAFDPAIMTSDFVEEHNFEEGRPYNLIELSKRLGVSHEAIRLRRNKGLELLRSSEHSEALHSLIEI